MVGIIIFILYFIFVAIYLLTSFFIVYHLARYSINPELRIVMLALFILVSGGLLFSNLLLFFSTDWTGILSGITPRIQI
ncbi:MAG TPA: hypothetical protein VF390_01225 [Patescibacteria group bacterium]